MCAVQGGGCGIEGHTNGIEQQIKQILRRVGEIKNHRLLRWRAADGQRQHFRPDGLRRASNGARGSRQHHQPMNWPPFAGLPVGGASTELSTMPHIPMVALNNRRTGFFERTEFDRVLERLPDYMHAPLRLDPMNRLAIAGPPVAALRERR
jgi:hypothetical protein